MPNKHWIQDPSTPIFLITAISRSFDGSRFGINKDEGLVSPIEAEKPSKRIKDSMIVYDSDTTGKRSTCEHSIQS